MPVGRLLIPIVVVGNERVVLDVGTLALEALRRGVGRTIVRPANYLADTFDVDLGLDGSLLELLGAADRLFDVNIYDEVAVRGRIAAVNKLLKAYEGVTQTFPFQVHRFFRREVLGSLRANTPQNTGRLASSYFVQFSRVRTTPVSVLINFGLFGIEIGNRDPAASHVHWYGENAPSYSGLAHRWGLGMFTS